ncbi:hypothetical protein [Scleromatobacter humisilvae]|uniref:Lipoprotein n=1 Tax=Scleromatobacter humisilvae TaxID=2897159 RepID=A0A9X1YR55_9BURK|nr:hypothetical protein [Scleromatobacter humisilvae]MCK9686856.1 hypothetical protein [Scleromatobacter humisilvae]
MRGTFVIVAMLACGGCAVLSNVTPIGDGAYMTVVRSNDVNGRVEDERLRATSQATAFCNERGAGVDVIKTVAAAPPPGQAPSAEIDFRCKPRP